jgi:hypothetical protein
MSPRASPSTIMFTRMGSKLASRISFAPRRQTMPVMRTRASITGPSAVFSISVLNGSVGSVR